jgi:hypothetical protein
MISERIDITMNVTQVASVRLKTTTTTTTISLSSPKQVGVGLKQSLPNSKKKNLRNV